MVRTVLYLQLHLVSCFKIWNEREKKLQIPQVSQTQGKSLEPAENHVLWKLLKLACLSPVERKKKKNEENFAREESERTSFEGSPSSAEKARS